MKRVTVIGVLLLLVIGMFAMPSSALTYETYLEDIQVNSGTTDIDDVTYELTNTSITLTTNYSRNITLPCTLANLSGAYTYINISAINVTINISYNLWVNSVILNTSSQLNASNASQWFVWNLTAIKNTVQKNASEYLNFTFNFNESEKSNVTIVINTSDASLSSTWLGTQVVTTEAFLSSPEIEDEQAHSFFAVDDKITITNKATGCNLTNVLLNFTYPTQTITEAGANWTVDYLNESEVESHTESYSKYGPYVFGAPTEEIDEDDHEVKIKVKSHEVLSNVVDWDFNETAEDYAEYFVTIDYDTLVVKLNNVKLDWEQGTIEMEDMTLTETLNTFGFTWTEAEIPPVPPVPGPWDWILEDYGTGIALWMWFVITAVVVGVVAVVAYIVRKK